MRFQLINSNGIYYRIKIEIGVFKSGSLDRPWRLSKHRLSEKAQNPPRPDCGLPTELQLLSSDLFY